MFAMKPILLVPCHIHKKKVKWEKKHKAPIIYVFFFHFEVFLKKKNKITMPFGLQIETKNV
jgi:hypothetical protein